VTPRHDRELEEFKKSIDLVEYAKKAGYQPRPFDVGTGLTLLDHPNGDAMIVARTRTGDWIYAGARDYVPRRPGESPDDALARLRLHIRRTRDQGTIVEFAQTRQRTSFGTELPLERVREHLRELQASRTVADSRQELEPTAAAAKSERSKTTERNTEPADAPAPDAQRHPGSFNPELNRRRYDWSPPLPKAPPETEVEQRLRRWREAQAAIDLRIRPAQQVVRPSLEGAQKTHPRQDQPTLPRTETLRENPKPELGRRRYDWTHAPAGVDAVVRASRNRSPDRGR
jgi:hypothetical protein